MVVNHSERGMRYSALPSEIRRKSGNIFGANNYLHAAHFRRKGTVPTTPSRTSEKKRGGKKKKREVLAAQLYL